MSWVFVVIVVALVGGGIAYYEHQQNTIAEVTVGGHGVSIQKN